MFKSVFAKYVTAVMTIFVVGFTVLLVVLTSIVSNSMSEGKVNEIADVSEAVAEAEIKATITNQDGKQVTRGIIKAGVAK